MWLQPSGLSLREVNPLEFDERGVIFLSGREADWCEHRSWVLAEMQNLRGTVDFLAQREKATQASLDILTTKVKSLMAEIDDLSAQVDATNDKLDALAALVPQLQATVASLQQQIANAPNDGAALSALTAKLKTHTDAAAAILNPPAPSTP